MIEYFYLSFLLKEMFKMFRNGVVYVFDVGYFFVNDDFRMCFFFRVVVLVMREI